MQIGSTGEFEIIEKIADGGMASVFKALQRSVNRLVALKLLHSHLEANDNAVQRFRKEKETTAGLSHPSIVRVWGAYQKPPPYYIAFEYLPNGTLASRLGRPMNPREALRIIQPICDALDYAHRADVVHRDVKPANIMFNTAGEPVLTDFGIARTEDQTSITISGARFGTAEYMSPEQAKGLTVDYRSDLYSIAAVFYHMVTGRPPFRHEDPLVTLRQIIEDPVPSPRRLNPSLPVALEKALLRGLHKHPTARFQTASAFAAALSAAVSTPVSATPRPTRKVPPARRRRLPEVTAPTQLDLDRAPAPSHREAVRERPPGGASESRAAKRELRKLRARTRIRRPAVELLLATLRRRAAPLALLVGVLALVTVVLMVPRFTGAPRVEGGGGAVGPEPEQPTEEPAPPEGETGAVPETSEEPTPTLTVPRLIGLSVTEAKRALGDVGLVYREGGKGLHGSIPRGCAMWQEPGPNAVAAAGATVTVRLSLGPPVAVPTGLVNRMYGEVRVELERRGLRAKRVDQPREGVVPGRVVRVEPSSGAEVAVGSTVTLYVSAESVVTVPNVIGKKEQDARRALEGARLKVNDWVNQSHDRKPAGTILNTDPAAGARVRPGSQVTLKVSRGPEPPPETGLLVVSTADPGASQRQFVVWIPETLVRYPKLGYERIEPGRPWHLPLPPGNYEVAGYLDLKKSPETNWSTSVEIKAGETKRESLPK